jgi:hypothetical protein
MLWKRHSGNWSRWRRLHSSGSWHRGRQVGGLQTVDGDYVALAVAVDDECLAAGLQDTEGPIVWPLQRGLVPVDTDVDVGGAS